jgi:hypothetical protein
MGFIYPGAFLMAPNGGFAFAKACCCKFYTCYCYRHSILYGSQTLEQYVVRYRAPEWDDVAQVWVFPDGQPCVPPGSRCTVIYEGITVKNCSCAGAGYSGESWSWSLIDCEDNAICPTILPPP